MPQKIRGVKKMMSKILAEIPKLSDREKDMEILRIGIIAELDAINLYEQLAAMTNNEKIKKALLDIAREEKTHMGEFQTLLLEVDKEQAVEIEKGKKEVEEM